MGKDEKYSLGKTDKVYSLVCYLQEICYLGFSNDREERTKDIKNEKKKKIITTPKYSEFSIKVNIIISLARKVKSKLITITSS